MKGRTKAGWKIIVILLASAVAAFGQANYMSQKPAEPPSNTANATAQRPAQVGPGTINYVEGQVSLNGQPLSPHSVRTTALKPGQVLGTGNGFVEVLLTPGAFLRLGHNSELRMLAAGLVDTKAQITRGTGLIEVDDLVKGTYLAVVINSSTTQIEKKGLYDFDANEQSVKVLDGKAKVMNANRSKNIGKGHEVLLASAQPLKSRKFNKNAVQNEELYAWSKARSETLAKANASQANEIAVNGGWYGPGWYWDPYWNFYSFLPSYGLYSPFGWGFYSPLYFGGYYGYPMYRGYYGHHGHFGHGGHVGGFAGRVHGFHSGRGFHGGAFHGGGFHGGGFHGGGGHGGGRR